VQGFTDIIEPKVNRHIGTNIREKPRQESYERKTEKSRKRPRKRFEEASSSLGTLERDITQLERGFFDYELNERERIRRNERRALVRIHVRVTILLWCGEKKKKGRNVSWKKKKRFSNRKVIRWGRGKVQYYTGEDKRTTKSICRYLRVKVG